MLPNFFCKILGTRFKNGVTVKGVSSFRKYVSIELWEPGTR